MLPVLNRTDIQMSDLDVVVATISPCFSTSIVVCANAMSPESIIRWMAKVEAQFG